MSDHISSQQLNALVDGEMPRDQLALAEQHLAECAACTSQALAQSLLKVATKQAGLRYRPTDTLETRIGEIVRQHSRSRRGTAGSGLSSPAWLSLVGAAAAILLVASIGGMAMWNHHQSEADVASAQHAALETEMLDQHIATLAADSPPQVISSDRHTVKPWFQGKLPFSFNLPENLPADTKLEGADLTYIHGQPAALLLYSIGKHRVSVFVTQRTGGTPAPGPSDRAGFHVAGFNTRDLDAIAVSDVDPGRLSGLVGLIFQAQSGVTLPAK
jgi:anti-sigma factor RsiW